MAAPRCPSYISPLPGRVSSNKPLEKPPPSCERRLTAIAPMASNTSLQYRSYYGFHESNSGFPVAAPIIREPTYGFSQTWGTKFLGPTYQPSNLTVETQSTCGRVQPRHSSMRAVPREVPPSPRDQTIPPIRNLFRDLDAGKTRYRPIG